jgi:hypothetical protein
VLTCYFSFPSQKKKKKKKKKKKSNLNKNSFKEAYSVSFENFDPVILYGRQTICTVKIRTTKSARSKRKHRETSPKRQCAYNVKNTIPGKRVYIIVTPHPYTGGWESNVSKITLEIPHFSEPYMQKYVNRHHIHTYAMLRFTYIFVYNEEKGCVNMGNVALLVYDDFKMATF